MRATRVSFVYILSPCVSASSIFKNSAHGSSMSRLNADKVLFVTDRLASGSNAVTTVFDQLIVCLE